MITIDLSNIWAELDLNALLVMESRVSAAHTLLVNGGENGKFAGWLELPGTLPIGQPEAIKTSAGRICSCSQVLVVTGTDSACLAARAVIELLQNGQHHAPGGTELLFVGDSLSTRSWHTLLQRLEGVDWSLNIVSKSGGTLESALAAHMLRRQLEVRYGPEGAGARIICTTDPKRGALRTMARAQGLQSFPIPTDVSEQYDALSAAVLLPLAVAGVDIDALLTGAQEAQTVLNEERSFNNPAWLYAAVRNLLYEKGKKIELLCTREPDSTRFGRWWQQLFAQSEGKQGKGLFPVSLDSSTGLHGLEQLIQGGERNLFETVLRFDPPGETITVETEETDADGLDYLAGRTLGFVEAQAFAAAVDTHRDSGVPVLLLECGPLNARTAGQLIYFFQLACAISAHVLGVNPFEQSGMEAYETNLSHLLGRPGF